MPAVSFLVVVMVIMVSFLVMMVMLMVVVSFLLMVIRIRNKIKIDDVDDKDFIPSHENSGVLGIFSPSSEADRSSLLRR